MGTIQRKIGSSIERKTAAFTAVPGGYYLCSTTGGSFTATLPSGSDQDFVTFSDDARTWGTNNLIIAPATGQTIDGLAANENLICDLTGAFVALTWNGTTWTIATNGFASSVSNGSLSSGSGSGSKNYISNTNNTTNWAASDANVLVADETTAANLPNNSTQTTAIRVTRVSGTTSHARYRFVMDQADYGKKFQLSFDMKYAGNAGDYKLEVYSFTSNAYTGGTLITPATTDIPAMTAGGTFTTTVDMPGSGNQYIEFRIRAAAGTTPLYLNSVYAGPGVNVQGAAISEWQSYTPTLNGSLTASTNIAAWRRVGSTMQIEGYLTSSTNGGSITALKIGLPTPGYTINYAALNTSAAANMNLGSATFSAATTTPYRVYSVDSLTFSFISPGNTDINANAVTLGTWISYQLFVPIAEWSGSGTVNLGPGAQVEYASSTSTPGAGWDAAATAGNTVYGPAGSPITGSLGANRTKVVRFQYPIQTTDELVLEFQLNGTEDKWVPAAQTYANLVYAPTVQTGAFISDFSNGTDVTVTFFQYAAPGTTFNSTTGAQNWSSGSFSAWRLKKVNPSSPVGFGMAGTDGSSGLYKAGQAPGLTTGAAISAGYIGQQLSVSPGNVTLTDVGGTAKTVATLTLTAGIWMVYGTSTCNPAGTSTTYYDVSINTTTNTQRAAGITRTYFNAGGVAPRVAAPPLYINTTGQDVYLVAAISGTGTVPATIGSSSEFYAVRIA